MRGISLALDGSDVRFRRVGYEESGDEANRGFPGTGIDEEVFGEVGDRGGGRGGGTLADEQEVQARRPVPAGRDPVRSWCAVFSLEYGFFFRLLIAFFSCI